MAAGQTIRNSEKRKDGTDEPMQNPRTCVICFKANCSVIAYHPNTDNIPSHGVYVVVDGASSTSDNIEIVLGIAK